MKHATAQIRSPAVALWAARGRGAAALAMLAIVAQLFAPAFHRPATPTQTALALRAAVGEAAIFCLQTDNSGVAHNPLDPSGSCDDHCPLCQLHANAMALLAPALASDVAPPATTGRALPARSERAFGALPRHALAQPRAPPFEI